MLYLHVSACFGAKIKQLDIYSEKTQLYQSKGFHALSGRCCASAIAVVLFRCLLFETGCDSLAKSIAN